MDLSHGLFASEYNREYVAWTNGFAIGLSLAAQRQSGLDLAEYAQSVDPNFNIKTAIPTENQMMPDSNLEALLQAAQTLQAQNASIPSTSTSENSTPTYQAAIPTDKPPNIKEEPGSGPPTAAQSPFQGHEPPAKRKMHPRHTRLDDEPPEEDYGPLRRPTMIYKVIKAGGRGVGRGRGRGGRCENTRVNNYHRSYHFGRVYGPIMLEMLRAINSPATLSHVEEILKEEQIFLIHEGEDYRYVPEANEEIIEVSVDEVVERQRLRSLKRTNASSIIPNENVMQHEDST